MDPDDDYSAEKFGWIPGCILEVLYLDDIETRFRSINLVLVLFIASDPFIILGIKLSASGMKIYSSRIWMMRLGRIDY
jgi:hypothetical protein